MIFYWILLTHCSKLYYPLGKTPFDLVLLDLRLPDSDGVETLTVATMYPYAVIVLTGRGDEALALQLLRLGALDFFGQRPGHHLIFDTLY